MGGFELQGRPAHAKRKLAAAGGQRLHEQFGYAYDAAWNLNYRTNDALVQTFKVNSLNELTNVSRSGTLTVAGAVTLSPTSLTAKDNANSVVAATVYEDNTIARSGVTLLDGNNTFTATAQDSYGRTDANTINSFLPSTINLQYDGNGNLTNDGRLTFQYDSENQLTNVFLTNSWQSEFRYDGLGRRRIRREYLWQSGIWNLQSEVRYIYDDMLAIQERDANNLPTVTYTRGRDLSGTFQGAGGIGGLLARTDNHLSTINDPLSTSYYHCDGNGNVTFLLYNNQQPAAKYIYDPFGTIIAQSGPLADANTYRFSTKEFHVTSGMYYYGYRFYEPSLQRWISRDPVEDDGFRELAVVSLDNWDDRANLYRFVYDDPILGVDAQGLTIYVCSKKAAAGVGNHTYFYDMSAPANSGCKSCGESGSSAGSSSGSSSGSSGSSTGSCGNKPGNCPDNGERGPAGGDSCQAIPGSGGSAGQSIMDCCKNTANKGIYVPCVHDCHNAVARCLERNGYEPPRNPRFGPPYVGPIGTQ